ncbi:MAG: hypothetical protein VSS75_000940 [Candidatus Parabeggiatoa sp.]|nr:hypothetical protein [Candidatus Parabeggiatoa sp.]
MMLRLTALGKFIDSHSGQNILMVAAIVILSLAFSIAFNIETILSYAISGDNFAPMLYSASFFDVSPVDWLINGFRYYFWVYPELFVDAHYFIRPTQNLLIYLISLFAETPNSALFLVTYYLVHSLCCALVYLYSRFFCRLSQKISLLVAFLFWGTMASEGVYVAAPAFGGEMLGALLGMGALLLTYVYLNHVDRYKRLIFATIFVLLMFTVYTKESIITAPFIVAIYWFWAKLYHEKQKINLNSLLVIQRNWVALVLLVSPIVVYVLHIFILRMIFDTGLAVYPFQKDLLSFLKTPIYTLLSYFFPLEQLNAGVFIKSLLNMDSQSPVLLLRNGAAVLFNLASLIFILVVFLKDKWSNGHLDSRFSLLIVLAIVSMAVPLTLHPGQRFMYFGQMFSIPLLIYTLSRCYDVKKIVIKYLAYAVLIAFVLLNPIYLFFSKLPMQRSEIITMNQASTQLQEVLRDELKSQQIKRVYLLNDITGHYAALTQLRFIAALANREDLQLRFVNSIIRHEISPLQKATEGVIVEKREADLCVTTRIDEEQFFFGSVGLHQIEKLGIAGIIQYEFWKMPTASWEDIKVMTACIPNAAKNDILLIGFDPAESGVHVWKSERPIWEVVR